MQNWRIKVEMSRVPGDIPSSFCLPIHRLWISKVEGAPHRPSVLFCLCRKRLFLKTDFAWAGVCDPDLVLVLVLFYPVYTVRITFGFENGSSLKLYSLEFKIFYVLLHRQKNCYTQHFLATRENLILYDFKPNIATNQTTYISSFCYLTFIIRIGRTGFSLHFVEDRPLILTNMFKPLRRVYCHHLSTNACSTLLLRNFW